MFKLNTRRRFLTKCLFVALLPLACSPKDAAKPDNSPALPSSVTIEDIAPPAQRPEATPQSHNSTENFSCAGHDIQTRIEDQFDGGELSAINFSFFLDGEDVDLRHLIKDRVNFIGYEDFETKFICNDGKAHLWVIGAKADVDTPLKVKDYLIDLKIDFATMRFTAKYTRILSDEEARALQKQP